MNFKNKIILAPMVSVTNIAFRKLCSDYGADIVYSQMIDCEGFIRGSRKLADFYDEDNLVCQFLGNDASLLVKCAREVEDKVNVVDVNMGCPDSAVCKRKCGSELMRYPKRIEKIVKALVKAVKIPITVKLRAGYDREHINAVEIAHICEKSGVSAIAVHGRARTVNYETPVDYSIIKQVKETVKVPVIGNGDVFDGESAKRMFDTECDSVMIGRGVIGNPLIFREIKNYLEGKKSKPIKKKTIFNKYIKYCKKYKINFESVKKQAQWFTKGVVGGGKLRLKMNDCKDVDGLKKVYNLIK